MPSDPIAPIACTGLTLLVPWLVLAFWGDGIDISSGDERRLGFGPPRNKLLARRTEAFALAPPSHVFPEANKTGVPSGAGQVRAREGEESTNVGNCARAP